MSTKDTSSPASRDSVSCTSAMVRMRRTDSLMAALASGEDSRRPCRRSSDEIVCRLFFTRWWISRMVASLDISRRSRRRSSEMSRSSTRHPVGGPSDSSGMQRTSSVTSVVWSSSSVTGARLSNAVRTGWSLNPSSPRRSPTALAWMPTRCRAETALGEAYSTRAVAPSRRTPSPTRGDALVPERSAAKGNVPAEIMLRQAPEDLQVGALQLAGVAALQGRPLTGEHPHDPSVGGGSARPAPSAWGA